MFAKLLDFFQILALSIFWKLSISIIHSKKTVNRLVTFHGHHSLHFSTPVIFLTFIQRHSSLFSLFQLTLADLVILFKNLSPNHNQINCQKTPLPIFSQEANITVPQSFLMIPNHYLTMISITLEVLIQIFALFTLEKENESLFIQMN